MEEAEKGEVRSWARVGVDGSRAGDKELQYDPRSDDIAAKSPVAVSEGGRGNASSGNPLPELCATAHGPRPTAHGPRPMVHGPARTAAGPPTRDIAASC